MWLASLLVALALGQDGGTLHHADIADGRPAGLEEGFFHAYETEAGFTLEVGDVLTLSTPLGSSASILAVGGGGAAGSVGLGLAHGTAVNSAWYKTIYNGTQSATMGKMVLVALGTTPDPALYMAPQSIAGTQVRVQRMKLAGTKKKPIVWAECEFVNTAERKNASGIITVGDVDLALRLGEVASDKLITREAAIQRLKEAKDLLDIGAYSQAQFDADKARYMPYIAPQ
jgi:hypothetical protein